jgi:ABC-type oligopeptide transport system ATPase subunit
MSLKNAIAALVAEDLARSNLVMADMNIRIMDSAERAATDVLHNIDGYVIPYYTLAGKPLPFYRVRLFNSDPKYRQPRESLNYVYFPPNFLKALEAVNYRYIILTEGEKKAALATKMGFPTACFGGVDSWRQRQISIPETSVLKPGKNKISAKLPPQTVIEEDMMTGLATGMTEIIDLALAKNIHILICYDTDEGGVKPQVQRAAATLGFELRYRGLPFNRVRQLVIPAPKDVKAGLDDFLVKTGSKFGELVEQTINARSAFPRHPSVRDFVNKRLHKSKLSRKELQAAAIALISEFDGTGMRLRNRQSGDIYYFDRATRKLIKSEFDTRTIASTSFGEMLYRRFGVSAADFKLFPWLASQFTGEDPIEEVQPWRILARPDINENAIHYQISDGQYVRVTSNDFKILDNGESGILFEAGQVTPLDADKLRKEFIKQQRAQPDDIALPFKWRDVLTDVRLKDQTKQKVIAGLLYYISPWLYRWRGAQLPVEMILGESGSGKSTLCELRLAIINGQAELRNAPTDLRDWHASIASSGGLHVTDNVQLVDRQLRQRLSDEICRIITEPKPHIEMRRLYSNAELMRLPVNAVFALTAIQQPFMNADLIQRAVIVELDKMATILPNLIEANEHTDGRERPVIRYDSNWRARQLDRFGGREGWVAHHLLVLQRFFQFVERKWNYDYQAKYRLINFEQTILLMAEVFGIDGSWIPSYLSNAIERSIADTDWTFEGIRGFVDQAIMFYGKKGGSEILVTTQQIADWASGHEDFQKCENLTNPRRLGHYMKNHRSMIATVCGLVEGPRKNNSNTWKLLQNIGPQKTIK